MIQTHVVLVGGRLVVRALPPSPAAAPATVSSQVRPRFTHSPFTSMPATSTASVLAFLEVGGAPPFGHWPLNATPPLPYVRTPDAAEWLEDPDVVYPGFHLGIGEDVTEPRQPTFDDLGPEGGTVDRDELAFFCYGTGFTADSVIIFDGEALPTTFVDAEKLSTTIPAEKFATVRSIDVLIRTADFEDTETRQFFVINPIVIDTVDPTAGPTAGGTMVTITGSGFDPINGVRVGGVVSEFTVVSDTEITVTTPPGEPGLVSIGLAAPGVGQSLGNVFTYVDPPTIAGISPMTGPEAGGTTVKITGTNLGVA